VIWKHWTHSVAYRIKHFVRDVNIPASEMVVLMPANERPSRVPWALLLRMLSPAFVIGFGIVCIVHG
jgi:hypothetical protein